MNRMRGDRFARMLSVVALSVAFLALILAWRTYSTQNSMQEEHDQQMEALGDLIRQSAGTGRPIMDMGPPSQGFPELDRGDN